MGEAGVFFFAISGTVTLFLVSRRVFADSLVEKYRNLRSLQPAIVARRLTVSDKRLSDDEAFSARDRFTVCLSSDWRNYQEMAGERDGRMISRLFEVYYNIVFAELARCVPSGRYYADWTADEIMVIFYGDVDEQRESVVREALSFTRALASDIPEKVKAEMGLTLKYDIGVAAGVGYLGLQGPSERRKTTIAGEVPGTAKRLETEGKELRPFGFDNDYPNVVMDEEVSRAAVTVLDSGWQSTFPAGAKNIKGRNVTLWRCTGDAQHTLLRLARA
jgi:class 3 adenylate cyclase